MATKKIGNPFFTGGEQTYNPPPPPPTPEEPNQYHPSSPLPPLPPLGVPHNEYQPAPPEPRFTPDVLAYARELLSHDQTLMRDPTIDYQDPNGVQLREGLGSWLGGLTGQPTPEWFRPNPFLGSADPTIRTNLNLSRRGEGTRPQPIFDPSFEQIMQNAGKRSPSVPTTNATQQSKGFLPSQPSQSSQQAIQLPGFIQNFINGNGQKQYTPQEINQAKKFVDGLVSNLDNGSIPKELYPQIMALRNNIMHQLNSQTGTEDWTGTIEPGQTQAYKPIDTNTYKAYPEGTNTSDTTTSTVTGPIDFKAIVPVGYITQPYGYDPKYNGNKEHFHHGLDIGTSQKPTDFNAPVGFKVILAGEYDGTGLTVRGQMDDGTILTFGHLTQADVAVGDYVQPGQHLGITGGANGDWRDGVSFGWHLHFAVNGPDGTEEDPAAWMSQGNFSSSSPASYQYTGPDPSQPPPTSPPNGDKWQVEDSINAIKYYWQQNPQYTPGFLQFVFGVALSESNLNPYAHGDTTLSGTGSWGIFQFYTGGGRGTGVPVEKLTNPYYQSEVNLPILWQSFQKMGGDSAWNGANRLQMFIEAYYDGQRGVKSIIEQRAPAVLQMLDNFVSQHPDVFGASHSSSSSSSTPQMASSAPTGSASVTPVASRVTPPDLSPAALPVVPTKQKTVARLNIPVPNRIPAPQVSYPQPPAPSAPLVFPASDPVRDPSGSIFDTYLRGAA